MPGFNITPEEIRSMGEKMKSYAKAMITDLDDITSRMNMVPNSYRGSASEEITQKYNALKPKFPDFLEQANACANFLINSAEEISAADAALKKAAGQNL